MFSTKHASEPALKQRSMRELCPTVHSAYRCAVGLLGGNADVRVSNCVELLLM